MTTAAHPLDEIRDSLRAALLQARNDDGGWGYRAGRQSRVEPTCFALLALGERATVLARWERRGGLLIDPAATHPNIGFTGIAALVAQHPALGVRDTAGELVGALLRAQGLTLPPSNAIVQDNSLVGWPWLDGTFSWVEPTAWCLMALKRWRGTDVRSGRPDVRLYDERIEQAERLLRDRACHDGGWNYGNRLVLGQRLRPYASTTALGLLALQDSPDDPVVRLARRTLGDLVARERSGYALALSFLAMVRQSSPPAHIERTLAQVWTETAFGGDVVPMALTLYAAEGREERWEAFGV